MERRLMGFLLAVQAMMVAAALGVLLLPLRRRATEAPPRAHYDRAVYQEQMQEIERDIARGVLGEAEAASARLEIERRLLATENQAPARRPASSSTRWVALALMLLVGGGSAGLYLRLGAPLLTTTPLAAHVQGLVERADPAQTDMENAAAALADHLKTNPADADGWADYGRAMARLNRWQDSADAFAKVVALQPGRADIAGAYGEMLVLVAGGKVTTQARVQLEAAVALDPHDSVARYYLALAQSQAGNTKAAIKAWLAVAADEPADSEIRAQIALHVADDAQAAGLPVPALPPPAAGEPSKPAAAEAVDAQPATVPGPGADEIAAAAQMSPDQRSDMIKGMVARLAARLEATPNDADGWLQLGRSWRMLGDDAKSAMAYDRASALRPGDPAIALQELDAIVATLKPADPLPARGMVLLARADAAAPSDPDALWVMGSAAARAQKYGDARRYWEKLLPLLPEGDGRKTVRTALDMLDAVAPARR
jgi:cytochrome c-type biogenesis protein CcmH